MGFLDEFIKGAGEIIEGASYGAIIGNWLNKGGNDALNDIEAFVKRGTDEMVDAMDAHLLNLTSTTLDSNQRRQLVKFYAFFKLIEFNKYQKWRGFPE